MDAQICRFSTSASSSDAGGSRLRKLVTLLTYIIRSSRLSYINQKQLFSHSRWQSTSLDPVLLRFSLVTSDFLSVSGPPILPGCLYRPDVCRHHTLATCSFKHLLHVHYVPSTVLRHTDEYDLDNSCNGVNESRVKSKGTLALRTWSSSERNSFPQWLQLVLALPPLPYSWGICLFSFLFKKTFITKLKQGFCINLEGWDGEGEGKEFQKGGDMCIPMAGSCWGLTENNKIL